MGYWAPRYFAETYYAPRYWPPALPAAPDFGGAGGRDPRAERELARRRKALMLQQLGEILGEDPPEEVNEKLRVILRTEAPPELATLDMDAIDTGVRAVQAVVALNAEVQRIKNTATFTAAQADEAERKLRLRDEDEAIIALLL